jgi:hypothetical protein
VEVERPDAARLRHEQAARLFSSGVAARARAVIVASKAAVGREALDEALPIVMRSFTIEATAYCVGLRYQTVDGARIAVATVATTAESGSELNAAHGFTPEDLALVVELAEKAARALTQRELELGL